VRDLEEKRSEFLKTVVLADNGTAGYDCTTCPYCSINKIDEFCKISSGFSGHRSGGIRPYHLPVLVRTRNFNLHRQPTVSLTGIGTGAPSIPSARTRSRFWIVREPMYPMVATSGTGKLAPYCLHVPRWWQ
jgi:hypothetical protein